MRFYLHTVILFLFLQGKLLAQPQQYLFSSTGVKDGLQEESVITVQEDATGYIWIASQNALQRFDGQRFLNFFPREGAPHAIPTGGIRGMIIDKKNRLWILIGKNTLGYFDVNNFKFHQVPVRIPANAENKNAVLHIDKDGHIILILLGAGIITYSEANNEVARQYNPFQLPAGWEPIYFWQDDARNYWVGSQNGLLKYSATKKMTFRIAGKVN